MYKQTEGFFQGYLEAKLYYQKWTPTGKASQGHIIITHGHGEHSDCYTRLVDALKPQNWTVWAWDMRGHGKSDGLRGYAADFNDYCNDFEMFLQFVLGHPELKKGPLVLVSHSMGGLVQLKSTLSHTEWPVAAQVCSSPMLGLSLPVPEWKNVGSHWLKQLLPQLALSNEIKDEDLSRDPEVIKEYASDNLRHDRMSSGVYVGALESMSVVMAKAADYQTPILLQIPVADPVCSSPTTEAFAAKLTCPHKLITYPDRKHEIYNDLGREEVFKDLRDYLQKVKTV